MSKKGARGRWNKRDVARYSADKKIDSVKWIKKNGTWRREETSVSEVGYCTARKERVGYKNGARIARVETHTTKDLIENGN